MVEMTIGAGLENGTSGWSGSLYTDAPALRGEGNEYAGETDESTALSLTLEKTEGPGCGALPLIPRKGGTYAFLRFGLVEVRNFAIGG